MRRYSCVRSLPLAVAAATAAAALAPAASWAQERGAAGVGALFPQPFKVVHQLVHTDPDGGAFPAPPTTDLYTGNWLVSQRPDGSRLLVDLARREIFEVDPARSAYWSLSFDRLRELREEVTRLDVVGPRAGARKSPTAPDAAAGDDRRPAVRVEEVGIAEATAAAPSVQGDGAAPATTVGARRFRASRTGTAAASPPTEVWLSTRVRLSPRAGEALARFEEDVLGTDGEPSLVAAVRRQVPDALPVRTLRRLGTAAEPAGAIETIALEVTPVAAVPAELLAVPEGYRRVPHPLETLAAFLVEDAARRQPEGSR